MWLQTANPTNSSLPMDSLYYRSIGSSLSQVKQSSSLPLHIRQDILNLVLREGRPLPAASLCSLLEGGVESLDLWTLSEANKYDENDMRVILHQLGQNLTHLRELRIGGFNWIYNDELIQGPLQTILASDDLRKLKSLCMQEASRDQLVLILGSCLSLRVLDIAQPSLSDRDMVHLDGSLRKHHSLFDLRIPSSLKSVGIIKLIDCFPNLKILKVARFENVLDMIEHSHEFTDAVITEQIQNTQKVVSGLRGLQVTHPLSEDSVERITSLLPRLEKLSLEVQDGMRLKSITSLRQLRNLEVHNSTTLSCSYLEQVLPILESIGRQLITLSLKQFDVLDLTSIARLCPALRSFSAQWFTIIGCNPNASSSLSLSRVEREYLRKPFSQLQKLYLRPRSQRNVHSDAVCYLLEHCTDLRQLDLYCCYGLNDEHLKSLAQRNGFLELRSLVLRHGHSVSRDGIQAALHRSPLEYMDCGPPILSKAERAPNEDD